MSDGFHFPKGYEMTSSTERGWRKDDLEGKGHIPQREADFSHTGCCEVRC